MAQSVSQEKSAALARQLESAAPRNFAALENDRRVPFKKNRHAVGESVVVCVEQSSNLHRQAIAYSAAACAKSRIL